MTNEANDVDETTDAALGIPAWLILFVIAATPVVFATGFSEFEVVKEFVLAIGSGVALAIWAGTLIARGRLAVVAGRVVALIAAFGLFVVGSLIWSSSILYGAAHASQLFALVAAVIVLSAPTERPVRFFDFAVAVSAGLGIAGVFGMLDLAGVGVFTTVWDPPGPTGSFDAMEFAVAYYAVAIPVALAAVQYVDSWARIFFGIAALLGAVHFGLVADWLFVGIFLGACLAAALLIVAFEGIETVMALSPIGAMVGLVLLVAFVTAEFVSVPAEPNDATSLPVLKRDAGINKQVLEESKIRNPSFAIGRMETVRSLEERAYLASVSFDLFQERPFVGRGAGAWWRLQTKHPNMDNPAVSRRFAHYPAYRSPHNAWSKLVVEYGVIGLALFALWLAGCAAIGLGALGRSGEHPSLIDEQWGLWALGLAGLAFATVTPLIELAPAAIVWVSGIAVLTRRSAAVNEYRGASMRWTIEGSGRSRGVGVVAAALAVGLAGIVSVDSVSRLYRGWGDQLMLRTYYKRAVAQYEKAHAWMPIRGDVLYNKTLARNRVGSLNAEVTDKLQDEFGNRGKKPTAQQPERSRARGDDEKGDRAGAAEEPPGAPDAGAPAGRDKQKKTNANNQPSETSRRNVIKNTETHRQLQQLMELRPYDARVLNLTAQFYVRWKFPKEALKMARRAVEAFPNNVSSRKTLATALRLRGDFDAAAEQLLTLLERSPPDREAYVLHYQLGRLYFEYLDEFVTAKEHFQSAKEVATSRAGRKRVQQQLKKVEQRLERKRRLREGKPPKDLEKQMPPGMDKGRPKPPPTGQPPE